MKCCWLWDKTICAGGGEGAAMADEKPEYGGGGGGTAAGSRGISGLGWVCWPSYVVTTMLGSLQDLSTLFFTLHDAFVHL